MPIVGTPAERKKQVFKEFGAGDLHSGAGGPIVTKRKQAVAIALSEQKPKRRTTALQVRR